MYEPQQYDSPPVYSPPYSSASLSLYPPRSVHSPRSQHVLHASDHRPPGSYYMQEQGGDYSPQHFHRWFSPPGFVKTFEAATVVMCFVIFVCVASTLVWDMHGLGYGGGGYGGGYGYGVGVSGGGAVSGVGSGYYGGSYGYANSYMTPYSAKSAMISMAAINFLVSLGFLVGSFSRSRATRGRGFYLAVFICDVILAVLQGIMDIIFVIGVNPMSQSSQSMLYNPMLMMCQNIHGSPSISFSLYNQYLQHYCYMDPEEAVALVLGLMVVLALSLAAYYAYKTRSKIWRHGKPNIYWDQPLVRTCQGQDVQDWVNHVGEGRSTQQAPTVVQSERAVPDLRAGHIAVAHGNGTLSVYSDAGAYLSGNNGNSRVPEPLYQNVGVTVSSRSSEEEEEADSIRKPPQYEERDGGLGPPARDMAHSQYETGYTSGGDTGNELDQYPRDHLYRLYPEITSEEERKRYKGEFDADLAHYKRLCAEMDDVSEQIHKLGQELDMLQEGSIKYQGVADEYNRLKDLKRSPNYQGKKKQTKELRQKLSHIKRLVKNFDLHV